MGQVLQSAPKSNIIRVDAGFIPTPVEERMCLRLRQHGDGLYMIMIFEGKVRIVPLTKEGLTGTL